MEASELEQILKVAFSESRDELPEISARHGRSTRLRNANLSKAWVEKLASHLKEYEERKWRNQGRFEVEAFCGNPNPEKGGFGPNEFLHDICIACTRQVRAPRHDKYLSAIVRTLWQVESEFSSDGTEAVKDFNKLVAGSAKNKLFIGPYKADSSQADSAAEARHKMLVEILSMVDLNPGDNWFLGQVPHPNTWKCTDSRRVKCWKFCRVAQKWVQ